MEALEISKVTALAADVHWIAFSAGLGLSIQPWPNVIPARPAQQSSHEEAVLGEHISNRPL